jgi:hypothetical protein
MPSTPRAAEPAPSPDPFRTRPAPADEPVACFWVSAERDPGLAARILEPFAKRGLVPSKWHGALEPDGGFSMDVQVAGLGAGPTEQIAQGLRQIPGVLVVLTAERRGA